MLTLHEVHASYDRAEVLLGVSLKVARGSITALVGSNGAGKTSLLRAILGAMPRISGGMDFQGRSILGLSSNALVKQGISLVPEGRRIFPTLTVLENLKIGRYICTDAKPFGIQLEEVYEIFPKLKERRNFLGSSLSGGEQQMLAIGRALMAEPKLLLLDEPSMGLAPVVVDQVFDVIQKLRQKGISILMVEQNAYRALGIADAGYVLENGRIVLSGLGSELLSNPLVIDAYLGA